MVEYKCPKCDGNKWIKTMTQEKIVCDFCGGTGVVVDYVTHKSAIDALNERLYDCYTELCEIMNSLRNDCEKENDPIAKKLLKLQLEHMGDSDLYVHEAYARVHSRHINLFIEGQLKEEKEQNDRK